MPPVCFISSSWTLGIIKIKIIILANCTCMNSILYFIGIYLITKEYTFAHICKFVVILLFLIFVMLFVVLFSTGVLVCFLLLCTSCLHSKDFNPLLYCCTFSLSLSSHFSTVFKELKFFSPFDYCPRMNLFIQWWIRLGVILKHIMKIIISIHLCCKHLFSTLYGALC